MREQRVKRLRTIEQWDEFLASLGDGAWDYRWVEVLEQGLAGRKCKVRPVDLLHVTAEYILTMLCQYEIDTRPVHVDDRVERLLAVLYSD